MTIVNHHFGQTAGLFWRGEVNVLGFQLFDHILVNILMDDCCLFRGTDHTVIKTLGHDQIVAGLLEIGRLVNNAWYVTRTYAQGRLTGGIGGTDHAGATGGQDNRDFRMGHQLLGCFNGWLFNPENAVFGGAGGNGSVAHNAGRSTGTLLGRGVESKDDRVTGFGGNDGFKQCGRRWVGYWRHTTNDTYWLSNQHEIFFSVVFNNADGLIVFD